MDLGRMPQTEAGPRRGELDFEDLVKSIFRFLTDSGFNVVASNPTFVRFASDRYHINVFHGRASYEIGVEVGRWLEIENEKVEQKFSLRDVIALQTDPDKVGYRGLTATDKDHLRRYLEQLAEFTRRFALPALQGDPKFFEALSEHARAYSRAMQVGHRASNLRKKADVAWKRRDYGSVVDAYEEIQRELYPEGLMESEAGRRVCKETSVHWRRKLMVLVCRGTPPPTATLLQEFVPGPNGDILLPPEGGS